MECHQVWLKLEHSVQAQAGRPQTRAFILWVVPEESTCVATHFRVNLARLRGRCPLSTANWSNARQVVQNQAMRVIESRPLRRFRARHTPFSLQTPATTHSGSTRDSDSIPRKMECRQKWLRVEELANLQEVRSHYLAVVQWIERVPPKRQIQVRFLSAGPKRNSLLPSQRV